MDETISFIFDGKIAAGNRMDFYESARFQYSASRLMVKLDNFRKSGTFPKKITYKNTPEILLLPSRSGSYWLEVVAPIASLFGPMLIEVPISAMFSYVVDRIFKSTDDDTIRSILSNQRELLDSYDHAISGRDNTIDRTLEMLQNRIDRDDYLNDEVRKLHERIISYQDRRLQLSEYRSEFRKINSDQEA